MSTKKRILITLIVAVLAAIVIFPMLPLEYRDRVVAVLTHPLYAGNHVGIGQDIAVFADEEAGAEIQIIAFGLFLRHVGHIGNEAFEEFVKRVVVGELAQVHADHIDLRM